MWIRLKWVDDMEGGAVDITRYTMRRLTDSQRDPNLFRFKALQKGPSGDIDVFSYLWGRASTTTDCCLE